MYWKIVFILIAFTTLIYMIHIVHDYSLQQLREDSAARIACIKAGKSWEWRLSNNYDCK